MFNVIKYAASQLLKDTFANPIHHISAARCFSTVFSSKNYAAQNGYLLKNLSSETSIKPLLSVEDPNISHTRNVTKYSLKTGKKKSVSTVLTRFFRLECGLWIRRRAGCHKRMHKKYPFQRHAAEQHVFCTKTQSLMLDAMTTDFWKKKKYFIDDPFEPYKVRNNFDWVQLKRRPQYLVALAFSGSVGMTLLVLGCALPQYSNWYPFFVIIFYLLAPLPTLISRRYRDDMSTSNACHELALFITTGIVISAFGLPIVLAEAPTSEAVIKWGACGLVLSGNVVVFLTILGFFVAFDNDDVDYSMW